LVSTKLLEEANCCTDQKIGADRVKRQSEVDTNDTEFLDAEKQPGFFDRAAKFVLELMQLFLRWINTDDS